MSTKTSYDTADLTPITPGSVVVGYDGSPDAQRSLEQAFEIAEALGTPLTVLRTWTIETAPHGALFDVGVVSSLTEVSAKVAAKLETESKPLAEKHPTVAVTYRGEFGHAAETLLALTREARMIVVGSRGLGGVRSLLLGSVSEKLVKHADCPVLVVRPKKAR